MSTYNKLLNYFTIKLHLLSLQNYLCYLYWDIPKLQINFRKFDRNLYENLCFSHHYLSLFKSFFMSFCQVFTFLHKNSTHLLSLLLDILFLYNYMNSTLKIFNNSLLISNTCIIVKFF